jgi:hypothetical protein
MIDRHGRPTTALSGRCGSGWTPLPEIGHVRSMTRAEALDNAPGRVILSRHLHVTEVRHGAAAVDLPQLFQGHLA